MNASIRSLVVPILAVALFSLSPKAWGETKPVVAVFNIQDSASFDRSLEPLTNYFRVKLAETGRFVVVPSAQIEQVLREQKQDSLSACYDQGCQIEIGKEVAAQKTLSLELIGLSGNQCAVTGTLYDLRLAASEKAASQKIACSDESLVAALENLAEQFAGVSASKKSAAVQAPKPPPPPKMAKLSIFTEPSGASVEIDGKYLGKSPIILKAVLGKHKVVLKKKAFLESSISFDLTRDTKINRALKPMASIKVVTSPSGATVKFGKSVVGVSPIAVPVVDGNHKITVSLDGHHTVNTTVKGITAGDTKEIRIPLKETLERIAEKAAYKASMNHYEAELAVYEEDSSNTIGWISFGIGVVAAGTSTGLAVAAENKDSAYFSNILQTDIDNSYNDAKNLQTAAISVGAVAAAAIAFAVVEWVFIGPSEPEPPSSPAWSTGLAF